MTSMQNSCLPTANAMSSRAVPDFCSKSEASAVMVLSCQCEWSFRVHASIARTRHHIVDVQDQGDPAIAQNGRGGDAGDSPVVGFEALDDDLTLPLDGVDEQRAMRSSIRFHEYGDAGGF